MVRVKMWVINQCTSLITAKLGLLNALHVVAFKNDLLLLLSRILNSADGSEMMGKTKTIRSLDSWRRVIIIMWNMEIAHVHQIDKLV